MTALREEFLKRFIGFDKEAKEKIESDLNNLIAEEVKEKTAEIKRLRKVLKSYAVSEIYGAEAREALKEKE